jgi:hypothetical protein
MLLSLSHSNRLGSRRERQHKAGETKIRGNDMSDEYTINEQEELVGHGDAVENGDEPVFEKGSKKKLIWQPMDYSIQGLYSMRKDSDLDPSPSWQRNYVFDKIKASRLIESALLDVPLPAVYLAEEADRTLSVIDGQQRLSTFFFFLDDSFPVNGGKDHTEFRLSGLQILRELNRVKYSELEKSLQLKIKNTPIHVIIIKNDSDEDVKFEIFERLNTGSMKLNEDEIRNSVYRGPYIELLQELSKNPKFDAMVRKPNFKNRMIYRGMILRFLALSEKTYINYRPSMKQFCNKELRNNRNLTKAQAQEYEKRFEKCVDLCFSTFGENAFRRFKPGDSTSSPYGNWTASRINLALFDIQMCGFAKYDDRNLIMGHTNEIREALIDMMCNDDEFIQSIEIQTSNTKVLTFRFKKWFDVLDSILVGSPPNTRTFPYAIKEKLFSDDPTCKLCGNRIMAIEDAEVDHTDPYSKGGPTTIENAQIAHRYCNRHKSDNPA